MLQQIAALQVLFAKYHDLQTALDNGYEFVGPCVSDPDWVGWAITTAATQTTTSAAVMAPTLWKGRSTWSMRRRRTDRAGSPLWITRFRMRSGHGNKAPEFFGIPFTRNDGFGVWMFHIWVFQHNPAGIFANFNPKVPQC